MNQSEQVIDVIIQTSTITADLLKSALLEFIKNPKPKSKTGKIKFGELAKKANGNLDSIEITQNNIGDFKSVAAKYNIDYSLKRDKSTIPPIYHVFFATSNTDNFKRAFREYASKVQGKHKDNKLTVSREQIKALASKVTEKADRNKDKVRTKEKQVSL